MNILPVRYAGLAALGLATSLLAQSPVPPDAQPRDVGLVETTGRRIAVIDISVTGPEEDIAGLTRADFELRVNSEFITEFDVDNLCALSTRPVKPAAAATEDAVEPDPADLPRPRPARVNYIFFVDQEHLTQSGRVNAVFMAGELIREFVRDGNRAILYSNGKDLLNFSPLTDRPDDLLAALEQLDQDRHPAGRQYVPDAALEDLHVREIIYKLDRGQIDDARQKARQWQKEEIRRARRAQDRLTIALQTIAEVDPPKVVFYFADTMRKNAGRHYADMLGGNSEDDMLVSTMETQGFGAAHGFDRVNEEAGANGIRFYTVRGEGLTNDTRGNSNRFKQANDTLRSMAGETGGRFFLGTDRKAGMQRMVEAVRQDLGCTYLLSFEPSAKMPEDELLPISVKYAGAPRDVKISHRGQMVLRSREQRDITRLLAAFALEDLPQSTLVVHGSVIPLGFKDGKFTGVVQAMVGGSPLNRPVWDLGLSVVAGGRVQHAVSGRVEIDRPGLPVVLEEVVEFDRGPYEVVMVARENGSGEIAQGRLQGEWELPSAEAATIGALTWVQPTTAVFLRDGRAQMKVGGSLGLAPEGQFADPARATRIYGLVCRRSDRKAETWWVRSRFGGDEAAPFEPFRLEFLKNERCLPTREEIPAGVMTGSGLYTYTLEVFDGDGTLGEPSASRSVSLAAIDPDDDPAALVAAPPDLPTPPASRQPR